jgi:hypothetical protein
MKVIFVLVGMIVVGYAINAGGGGSSNSSGKSHTTTQPTLNQLFNQHYENTQKMCSSYSSLVDQGWTDGEIYTQLKNAGAFDGWVDTASSTMYYALIKWCYKH